MSFMQPCSDENFEWIRSGRAELLPTGDPSWRGNFVSHLLPARFEAYAKILHGIEARYENIDNPLSDREIALLKIPPCTRLRSFVESLRREGRSPRVRWKTLAHLLDVPFEPEICHEWFRTRMEGPVCWPRFLSGPDEGTLDADELSEVISVLRPFTQGQDCFLRFSMIPFIGTEKPILFRGSLEEIVGLLSDSKYRLTPEYWWPADCSWCLCSDYDLVFTIVGGSKDAISAVLRNPILEALEVNPKTRIDSLAPIPK